jgi:3-phenylpropionate/cinnamic acid dioxygenase small subunit
MIHLDTDACHACQDLMIRSYRLVDEGHAGRVTELFTDDGRFAVGDSIEVSGKESLASFFAAREAEKERKTRHCLTNLSFSPISADEAAVRATLLLFVLNGSHPTTPSALADVEDRCRWEGGGWRIAERTTTLVAGGA